MAYKPKFRRAALLLLFSIGAFGGEHREARAQSIQQTAPPFLHPGFAMLENQQFDEAEFFFQQQLEAGKKDKWLFLGLGLVYWQRGESAIKPLEAFKRLFKIDNWSKAQDFFERAREVDPDFLEADYYEGRVEMVRNKPGNYRKAREIFAHTAQKDSTFLDIFYQSGLANLRLHDFDNAIGAFTTAQHLHPEDFRAPVASAEAYIALGRLQKGSEMYFDHIRKVRDADFLDDLFEDIRIMVTKEDQERFEASALPEKALFMARFWKQRDPTPTTVGNERLAEHFRRVAHARMVYSIPVKPFYDDRGKIYIRYGEPDARYVSPLYSTDIRANESWSYESIAKGLVFDFVEWGSGFYREVSDLLDATQVRSGYPARLQLTANLYSERSHLSDSYSRLAFGFDENRLMSFIAAKETAHKTAPTDAFRFNYRARPMSFAFDWAQFQGAPGMTTLDFYFGIGGSQLGFRVLPDGYHSTLRYTLVIEDSLLDEVYRNAWGENFLVADSSHISHVFPLAKTTIDLPPGRYDFSLVMENKESAGLGIYRFPMTIKPFSQKTLQISDLEFAFEIRPQAEESDYNRNGLWIKPYPLRTIRADKPVFVYCEIYNLQVDAGGKNSYIVDYNVRVKKEKTSFLEKLTLPFRKLVGSGGKKQISTSFEQSDAGARSKQYLALDASNLPAGEIEIQVQVTDRLSQNKISAAKTLELFR